MSPASRGMSYLDPTFAVHLYGYSGRLRMGGKNITLHSGDITCTPPDTSSRYEIDAVGTHLCIHFHPTSRGASTTLPAHIAAGPHSISVHRRLVDIIGLHRSSSVTDGATSALAAGATLQALLLRLTLLPRRGKSQRTAGKGESILPIVVDRLDTLYAEPFSLSAIAAEFDLSPDYLGRMFRARYGMNIARYLLERRIEIARHLLFSTRKSIKEIAFDVGIPDAQYFNKQYRSIAGCSPTAARAGRAFSA